jgi:hypothetical protein
MHFLLAVSHSELSIHQGGSSRAPHEALSHFRAGSDLLHLRLEETAVNHLEVMLTYLYLFQFWLRREKWFAGRLQDLSMSILVYVKAFGLDEVCGSTATKSNPEDATTLALIARILCYLFDRDGFAAFSGIAGFFANVAMQDQLLWQNVWLRFQSAFPLKSKREAAVIDAYYRLIWIHHEVNCYSQNMIESKGDGTRILSQLKELRQVCRSTATLSVLTLAETKLDI